MRSLCTDNLLPLSAGERCRHHVDSRISVPSNVRFFRLHVFLQRFDLYRMTEVFIGIIILCIPAAARSCRHHAEFFEKIQRFYSVYILRRSQVSLESNTSPNPNRCGSDPYTVIIESETYPKTPMNCLKASHIAFGHGRQYNIEKDDDISRMWDAKY